MSVIGRTYRGSLPSQSGLGHKEEDKEEEEEDKEEEEEEAKKAELEFGDKYNKMGDKQFVMENGWEGKGEIWSENDEMSDLEREEKGSIYLGDFQQEFEERSQSLCSVCSSRYSRSNSSPVAPQPILPTSSSSTPPSPYHFSPSSPRPSLFQCRECCFDNSPLSCQLVAIPAFPSPSLGGEGRSDDGGKRRMGRRMEEGEEQMEGE